MYVYWKLTTFLFVEEDYILCQTSIPDNVARLVRLAYLEKPKMSWSVLISRRFLMDFGTTKVGKLLILDRSDKLV